MSGPSRERQCYHLTLQQWDQLRIDVLRQLANDMHTLWGADDIENADQIAALLHKKADRIEAAMGAIDAHTHDSFDELVKAIQWHQTGDYGPEHVNEAWETYDEA